jgi:hypothetical protein
MTYDAEFNTTDGYWYFINDDEKTKVSCDIQKVK